MFGTFRKHSTWLWGIIIAATAVSLVWWTGNRGGQGGNGGPVNFGSISGRAVSPDDFYSAAREMKLQYRLSRGEWPDAGAERLGFDLQSETYKRLFIIQKQEEMGIHISQQEVARVAAKEMSALSQQARRTITAVDFEREFLAPGGLNLGDYERFLKHNLGMQQMLLATGVGGKLITAPEARLIYERENQDISAQAVFFNASNYVKDVVITPDALKAYYTNNLSRYRLPDRVQVAYVRFEVTNFWAEAGAELAKLTNFNALIDAEYQRRGGTNYYTDMTAEQAKQSMKNEEQRRLAFMAARKRAVEFADPLLSQEKITAESLAEAARKQGLTLKVTTPFDRSSVPAELDATESFARAAFALREDEPVAGPIVSGESIYLIARNRQIPSEIPSFESIEPRVANEYKMDRTVQAARAAGMSFALGATNGLAQGKAFATLCAEARVASVLLPPFSLSTRSLPDVEQHIMLQQFKRVAFDTPVGQCSPFVQTAEGGVVVFVQSKLPLDEKKAATEFPQFLNLIRQARQSEAFQEWFAREARTALADTPAFRPNPSEMGGMPSP